MIQGEINWDMTFNGVAEHRNGTAARSRNGVMAGGSNSQEPGFAIAGTLRQRNDDYDGTADFFGLAR